MTPFYGYIFYFIYNYVALKIGKASKNLIININCFHYLLIVCPLVRYYGTNISLLIWTIFFQFVGSVFSSGSTSENFSRYTLTIAIHKLVVYSPSILLPSPHFVSGARVFKFPIPKPYITFLRKIKVRILPRYYMVSFCVEPSSKFTILLVWRYHPHSGS